MSWHVEISDLSEHLEAVGRKQATDQNAECGRQYDEALEAAHCLVRSGTLGKNSIYRFGANLSGHQNPDHVPREGWSPDTITVTVFQVKELRE